jgi:hypothetical protein
VAGRPGDRHPLFNGLPLGSPRAAQPIDQDYGVILRAHTDVARRLATAGPGTGEVFASVQPPLAMPAAYIDADTGQTFKAYVELR